MKWPIYCPHCLPYIYCPHCLSYIYCPHFTIYTLPTKLTLYILPTKLTIYILPTKLTLYILPTLFTIYILPTLFTIYILPQRLPYIYFPQNLPSIYCPQNLPYTWPLRGLHSTGHFWAHIKSYFILHSTTADGNFAYHIAPNVLQIAHSTDTFSYSIINIYYYIICFRIALSSTVAACRNMYFNVIHVF